MSCYWRVAVWKPFGCKYHVFTTEEVTKCLENKKILLFGDSTIMQMMDSLIEKTKSQKYAQYLKDKNHFHRMIFNNNKTLVYQKYYRQGEDDSGLETLTEVPKYAQSRLDTFIERLKPNVQLDSEVSFFFGGSFWLSPVYLRWLADNLKGHGLDKIQVYVKSDSSAYHHPYFEVHRPVNQENLLARTQALILEAEKLGMKVINVFNITASRFTEFAFGGFCACHYNRPTELTSSKIPPKLRAIPSLNDVYTNVFINVFCSNVV